MESEFDASVMFNNIAFLASEQNKRIGELESQAGVSTGYIARTRESNSKPGVEFVMRIAEALHVTMDTLIKTDLSSLTATEQYLVQFLGKLIRDTDSDKLDWNTESAGSLNRIEPDQNGYTSHPLIHVETFYEKSECEYPDEITRPVFQSRTFDVHTAFNGDSFNLRLKNGTMLYLMSICKSVHYSDEKNVDAVEVWMCGYDGEGNNTQYLCSNHDSKDIASLVNDLYSSVAENSKHPKIKPNLRYAIDAFMKDDLSDDPDEGLPF